MDDRPGEPASPPTAPARSGTRGNASGSASACYDAHDNTSANPEPRPHAPLNLRPGATSPGPDRRITVCDVGPRDGLQNEERALTPAVRAELVVRLAACGLPVVEAGSAVRDDRVPRMAGLEEVLQLAVAARLPAGCDLAVLTLNARGTERALATDAARIHLAYPVTDAFCERNQGTSAAAAAAAVAPLVTAAHAQGRVVSVTLAAAFGCPFAGETDPGLVAEHAGRAIDAGADLIVLADTIGSATPRAIRRALDAVSTRTSAPVGLHLHNTRNAGYANALAGLENGVRWLDSSVGGFGGCPFAPDATGNIATEDLAWILDREGVDHGLDIDRLNTTALWLADHLDRPAPGLLHRAGRFPSGH